MALELAQLIVGLSATYASMGVVFAILFLPRALVRLDAEVAGASWTLRLVILPGVAAFWPLFLRRWLSHARLPTENNPHRARAAAPAAERRTVGRSR